MRRCHDTTLLLGSYALGGLEPDEAAEVERHLSTCTECRDVYARLAPLPRMLELIDPAAAVDTAPSPELERSVLAGFATQHVPSRTPPPRRRRRPALKTSRWRVAAPSGSWWRVALPSGLAGAVACLAVLAATGVPSSSTNGDDDPVTLAPATGVGDARAEARLADSSAGTGVKLEAELPPLRPGEVYEMWFVRADGRVSAGTFTVDADGRADLELATAARIGDYDRLGITREPDGLDPARNGPSVVAGDLRG